MQFSNSKNDQLVALKVVKSAKHYTEAALDEIKILRAISASDPQKVKRCVHLLDDFEHKGPHGKRKLFIISFKIFIVRNAVLLFISLFYSNSDLFPL
jgi:hypothetical protein